MSLSRRSTHRACGICVPKGTGILPAVLMTSRPRRGARDARRTAAGTAALQIRVYTEPFPAIIFLPAPCAPERHPMASPAVAFARSNQPRFLDELKSLLRIPSISTLTEHKSDVQKAAEFVAAELRRIGMENVEIIPTKGHPLLYADWLHAAGKPTVLMYAHYDVQPPDPLDEWHTPPFEPTERNSNIYARGAVDDKGQSGWR